MMAVGPGASVESSSIKELPCERQRKDWLLQRY
jgi:hypothetical protein